MRDFEEEEELIRDGAPVDLAVNRSVGQSKRSTKQVGLLQIHYWIFSPTNRLLN